ncbi:MAG: condensation domain-containing protein [Deltaproteobacteria bacterium]|nr:condensation domain-containing protein [Deltaproteobacteria bacterium]
MHPSNSEAPASFGQERLWFLDHFDGAKVAYNRPANLRFTGALNVDTLRRSLDEIVQRHEVLRTDFCSVKGRPIQQIRPDVSLPLPLTDLSDLPPIEREAEAQRIAVEEARRPFDLAQGPLVRGHLLRLNHDDHVLLLTVECAEVSSLGREDSGLDLGRPFRLQRGGQREEYRPLVRRSPGGKTAQLERDAPEGTMR